MWKEIEYSDNCSIGEIPKLNEDNDVRDKNGRLSKEQTAISHKVEFT